MTTVVQILNFTNASFLMTYILLDDGEEGCNYQSH